jgi:asparagine synthase (glutamine-hydrolysing)
MRASRWKTAYDEVRQYATAQGQPVGPLMRDTVGHWLRRTARDVPGFAAIRARFGREDDRAPGWVSADLRSPLSAADLDGWAQSLSLVLRNSVERRPLPLYLRVEDRNSMAHSVEARLPFLDYRLVSLAFSLPNEWKLRGGWNKYLVRQAMKGVIAEPVRTRRDKMGFPTPSGEWWKNDWYEPMMDLLGSSSLRDSGAVDVEAARQDLRHHVDGQVDAASRLFRLAEFGTWLHSGQESRTAVGERSHTDFSSSAPVGAATHPGSR